MCFFACQTPLGRLRLHKMKHGSYLGAACALRTCAPFAARIIPRNRHRLSVRFCVFALNPHYIRQRVIAATISVKLKFLSIVVPGLRRTSEWRISDVTRLTISRWPVQPTRHHGLNWQQIIMRCVDHERRCDDVNKLLRLCLKMALIVFSNLVFGTKQLAIF